MALLVPDQGEQEMLRRILNGTDKCVIHLYTGDKAPLETDKPNTYQEVTGGGYGPLTLDAQWQIGSATPTEASYSQINFNFTGSASVGGYFVTSNDSSILLWAEKFIDGPYNIPSGGGSVKITPKIQLD